MAIIKKKRRTSPIPEAITYIQLILPSSVPLDVVQIKALRESIALQSQGEAVEILEKYPIPFLMIAFDVVHRTSPEMILRLNSGKRVLLFDHWSTPVLRDKDIQIISNTIDLQKSKAFTSELIINLDDIWKKIQTQKRNNLKEIENFLKVVKKQIKPSEVTTLVGSKAPALFFLLTQHLLYGKTGKIWYQENLNSKPIKITQI